MDRFNLSHSRGTYWLMRAEHIVVVVACSVLLVANFRELNLWRFLVAFVVIDLVGYVPGLVVYLRRRGARVPDALHYLYNACHSYLTWAVVALAWYLASGWEWAMLAIPLHLSGDRGLFGNVFKPAGRSFEPKAPSP